MSLWIDDSELFLYKPYISNNAPAQIWRCKNMTASVPLKAADFIITETTVTSRLDLVGASSSWSEQNYKDLLAYIRDKHFLVNCKGEIFVENFPFDDINQTIDPSTIVYLRAADAINMKKFGFLSPPKLPIRKIKYLDSNPVKDAEMMPQSFVDGGEDPPVICPPVIKPVICPPVVPPVVTDSSDDDDDNDVEDFGDRPRFDPSWMTYHRDWLNADGIMKKTNWSANTVPIRTTALEVTRQGTNFGDDNTTNVRRDLFYGVKYPGYFLPVKVVLLDSELSAQGRFDPRVWGVFSNGPGTFYVGRMIDNSSPNQIIF